MTTDDNQVEKNDLLQELEKYKNELKRKDVVLNKKEEELKNVNDSKNQMQIELEKTKNLLQKANNEITNLNTIISKLDQSKTMVVVIGLTGEGKAFPWPL